MSLADRVHVARRYRRAIRLEADLGNASALEGFICSRTASEVLESMARHVLETEQCAFTWTGPYGGGKSSLAVALGSLLGESQRLRQEAARVLGERTAALLREALPPRSRGWRILPVTGRRDPARAGHRRGNRSGGLAAGGGNGNAVVRETGSRCARGDCGTQSPGRRRSRSLHRRDGQVSRSRGARRHRHLPVPGTRRSRFSERGSAARRRDPPSGFWGIRAPSLARDARRVGEAPRSFCGPRDERSRGASRSICSGARSGVKSGMHGAAVPRRGCRAARTGTLAGTRGCPRGLLAPAPGGRVPARTPFAPAIRPEPAKSLRFPQFG